MPLLREFHALVHQTWQLWSRYLPRIGTWLLAGWIVYIACLMASAALGNSYGALGSIIFVVGVTANVVGVIFAIHALKPGLTTAARLAEDDDQSIFQDNIPETVLLPERRIDVAILAIGPVLGVYAVWALIDGMIRDGLVWNTFFHSHWNPDEFSFGRRTSDLPFYLMLGGVAFVARLAYGWLVKKRTSTWWRVPLIFLEGMWVFAAFFVLLLGVETLHNWLLGRAFWRTSLRAWHDFLAWLPEVSLPFGWTLPEAVRHGWIWLSETLIPGVWQGLALPLVWLAIAAIVFGWREFRARDLFTTPVRERVDRLDAGSDTVRTLGPAFLWLTADLRMKWLPLFHSMRLVWRSGPYVLGAYLVLSTLLEAAAWAVDAALSRLFEAGTQEQVLRSFTAVDTVTHLLVMSVSVCLYATVFDRGLTAAAGLIDPTTRAVAPRRAVDDSHPEKAASGGAPQAHPENVQ